MKTSYNLPGRPLSRLEKINIKGGLADEGGLFCKSGSCELYVPQPDGTWKPEAGTCDWNIDMLVGPVGNTYGIVCFCNTKSSPHPVPLSSNGGVSKCKK